MSESKTPRLSKWPYFMGDLLLVLVAAWVVYLSPHPLTTWPVLVLGVLTMPGAWLSVLPFTVEYRAAVKLAETEALTTVVEQINDLRTLANQISFATAQWQVVQDQASQTVKASQAVAERMTAEARAFTEFMQKANDSEKAHLRLEVEKLHRAEGEWLQGAVRLLDHVYALYQAGLRSGQPVLIEQLNQFQNACRESVRRVGLSPFEAKVDEAFDEKAHVLAGGQAPIPGAVIRRTVAPGYTFQGQLLRLPLVDVHQPPDEPNDLQNSERVSVVDDSGADGAQTQGSTPLGE